MKGINVEEDRNGCIKCNPFQRAELTERKLDFSENPALRSPGRRGCGRPDVGRQAKVIRGQVGSLGEVATLSHLMPLLLTKMKGLLCEYP